MPEKKSLIGCWGEMRATLKQQQTEPEYQFTMPLPSTAHPGVTTQGALPKMQNKQDELAASIGDLAPEEEALKMAGSNSEPVLSE